MSASRDDLVAAWTEVAMGLASPKRIELLDVLAQDERRKVIFF